MDNDQAQRLAGKFLDRQFTVTGDDGGKTHFTITKLMPFEGFRVLDKIREAVGEQAAKLPADASVQNIIVAIAMSIPSEKLEAIMRPLFTSVTFTSATVKTPAPVADHNTIDEMAFNGLEPITIYNLLLRCLAVNFFSSFTAIKSLLATANPSSNSPNTETSTPSSQTPSTQE